MSTILTPEQFKQRYGDEGLNKFSTQLIQRQEQPERPGFFSRVGEKIKKRGEGLSRSFSQISSQVRGGEEKLAETEVGAGARLALRTGGTVAGGIFDIFTEGVKSLLGQKGTEKVKEATSAVVGKLTEPEIIQKAVTGLTQWAEKNPEAAQDLENIVDIAGLIPVGRGGQIIGKTAKQGLRQGGKVVGQGAKVAGKGLTYGGAAGEKIGKKIVSSLYTPTKEQAIQVVSYKAKNTILERLGWAAKDIEKAPRTIADTVIKYNLSGIERSYIGSKAKKIATDLFENQVKPALDAIKGQVSKKTIFDAIKKDILQVKDISRRKALLGAMEAMADDYKYVSRWSYKTLDKIKSDMAKRLPSKVWKGQEIAGDMNNLRLLFSAHARKIIRSKLPRQILDIYDDYGSLKEIVARGSKALTKGFDAGVFGLTSEAVRALATPFTTIGGKAIHQTGKIIKKTGQLLQK